MAKLTAEAEVETACMIFSGVRGPQHGERLAHRSAGISDCASTEGLSTLGAPAVAEAPCEKLDQLHFVGDLGQEWVLIELQAKSGPNVPGFVRGGGAARNDSKSGLCLHKADVSAECILGRS